MIKTERKQIHFLSDVLVAFAVLDLKVPSIVLLSTALKIIFYPRHAGRSNGPKVLNNMILRLCPAILK